MNAPYAVTLYPSLTDSAKFERRTYEWSALVELLSVPKEYPAKEAAPLFGPYALRAGALRRSNEDFEAMSLAVFDVDQGDVAAVNDSQAALRDAGVLSVWYTSWSFPTKNSWRCVIPLARPVGASDWARVRLDIARRFALSIEVDKCSGTSHAYYLPAIRRGSNYFTAHYVPGQPFDPGAVRPVFTLSRAAPVEDDELFPAGPFELNDLKERVFRRAQKFTAEGQHAKATLLHRTLQGEVLPDGRWVQSNTGDPPMTSLCSLLVWHLHPQPFEAYEALLRPTVEKMQAEGYKVPWYKVRTMLRSAARKKLQTDADNEAFLSKAAAAAAAFNAPK